MNELKQAFVTLYPTLTSDTEQMNITAHSFIFFIATKYIPVWSRMFLQAVTDELLRGIIMIYECVNALCVT